MKLQFNGKISINKILDEVKKQKSNYKFNPKHIINSFIFGDNFEVLSKLLRNGLNGKIDFIYIDPPFSTNRNFRANDKRTSTISYSRKDKLAYNDMLSGDAYLAYIWKRFVLLYQLLSPRGSMYVHIDSSMGPYFKVMLDEIFGNKNFKNEISRIKCNPKNFKKSAYGNNHDCIYFYSKDHNKNIWNDIRVPLTTNEIHHRFKHHDNRGWYTTIPLHAPGETKHGATGEKWHGLYPPKGRHWRTKPSYLTVLNNKGLIHWSSKGNPRLKKYSDSNRGKRVQDTLLGFKDSQRPSYPTQKNLRLIKLLIKESTAKDSIVLDAFAGSGTTLKAAKSLNRKFIGIDNSKVSLNVIRKRIKGINIINCNSTVIKDDFTGRPHYTMKLVK